MKRNSGFTLIELMAVIGIIILLAGILMPALNTARRQARKTECMNNIRQLGIALQAYAMDNNSNYPNSQAVYNAQISNYVDNTSILQCPENAGANYTFLPTTTQLDEDSDSDSAVLQDAASGGTGPHSGNSYNILFKGGHVRTSATAESAY